MKPLHSALLGVIGGALFTAIIYTMFVLPQHVNGASELDNNSTANKASEPLYWVAPMDPNFRRDEPGLSPMGMDLVPVYPNTSNDSPGTVHINPTVINNLGVKTALAERRVIQQLIKTIGYVQYSEDTLVHIHPRVEGWVETLYVKARGDYVEKGEPLYSLYSPELVNAQEEYLVALSRGSNNLREASSSRLNALQMPQQAISKLLETKKVQQTVVFTAPQTGFIDNLNIREGFYVEPDITMMSIAALDEVWVDAQVFEREASFVKTGLAASMRLDYLPGKKWQGKVDYIYPSLDERTRTLKLRMRFDNPDYLLKPNMFAQVLIETDDQQARLVVPKNALIRTGSQNRVVLALGDGKFKSVAVELGQVMSTDIEVLNGIEEGDRVVISAQFLLDSESSISSDFKRMSVATEQEHMHEGMHEGMDESVHQQQDEALEPVWVLANIKELMSDERMVRMEHEAIDEWGMMAMTMNFKVAADVDFTSLKVGTSLHAQIAASDSGPYTIIGTHIMGSDGEMQP